MNTMFEQVVIIGPGLLGGSMAIDLRRRGLAANITGVCRSRNTAELALQNGVVDAVAQIPDCVPSADLVVIATPMQTMPVVLAELAPHVGAQTSLTDVGSVKQSLYELLEHSYPHLLTQFVLAHPIAGGEQSGVNAAVENLFLNKNVIITPTDQLQAQHRDRVQDCWQQLGANVVLMSLQEHDAVFAKTSHLPHVIAFSLVNYLRGQSNKEQLFNMAAAGFYDFTRIASSNAEMWRDICVTNQAEVIAALEGFSKEIETIKSAVVSCDQAKVLNYFNSAKQARDDGLLQKASKHL